MHNTPFVVFPTSQIVQLTETSEIDSGARSRIQFPFSTACQVHSPRSSVILAVLLDVILCGKLVESKWTGHSVQRTRRADSRLHLR